MMKQSIKMIRVGFCQYSDFKNRLSKGLFEVSEKVEEFKEEVPNLRIISYEAYITPNNHFNKRIPILKVESTTDFKNNLLKGFQEAFIKIEEFKQEDPGLKTVSYEAVIKGEY